MANLAHGVRQAPFYLASPFPYTIERSLHYPKMTMKGVFFSSKLPNLTEIRDLDIPEPGDDEILVKNVAVASNPKDWKVPMWMPEWEAVEGNDIAGTVEKVGKNVSEFKEGDRVAAFTVMRTNTKYGA